jgi:tetratricopeptide (TPR) repeat protein
MNRQSLTPAEPLRLAERRRHRPAGAIAATGELPLSGSDTATLSPAQLMWLQQTAGNAAVDRFLSGRTTTPGSRDGSQGTAVQRQQRRRSATGESSAATEPLPDRLRELFEQAVGLFQAGRQRQAIIAFERVRQTPGVPAEVRRDSLYNIGMANLRLGRFATAVIYFEEYLRAEGANVEDGHARLAEAQRGAGVPAAGEPSPDRLRQLFEQAAGFFQAGQYRQAIITFERVRQTAGVPAEVRRDSVYNIGMANLRLSRFATALIYFEEYLRTGGANVEDGHVRLAEAQRGAGISPPQEFASNRAPAAVQTPGAPRAGTSAVNPLASEAPPAGLDAAPDLNDPNRVLFNLPITREQAVAFLWEGRLRPADAVFRPAGDPLELGRAESVGPRLVETADRYWTFFLDRTFPILSELMRPETASLFPYLRPGERGALSALPDWVPVGLRNATQTRDVPFGPDGVHIARWTGTPYPFGNAIGWMRRSGRRLELEAFLEYPWGFEYYLDVADGNESVARLLYETCREINADVWFLVEQRRYSPRAALAELARINAEILALIVEGAVSLLSLGAGAGITQGLGARARQLADAPVPATPRPRRPPSADPEMGASGGAAAAGRASPSAARVQARTFDDLLEAAENSPRQVAESAAADPLLRIHDNRWQALGGTGSAPHVYWDDVSEVMRVDLGRLSAEQRARYDAAARRGGLRAAESVPGGQTAPASARPASQAEARQAPPASATGGQVLPARAHARTFDDLLETAENNPHLISEGSGAIPLARLHETRWRALGGTGEPPAIFWDDILGTMRVDLSRLSAEQRARYEAAARRGVRRGLENAPTQPMSVPSSPRGS